MANGTVDAAIIGVASNIVDPKLSFQYLNLGLLSQDGLCRAFDKYGNVYIISSCIYFLFCTLRGYNTLL